MKTRKKTSTIFRVFLSLLFFIAIALPIQAQIGIPDDGEVDDTPGAPIDGFIGMALIAGVCYGAKKITGIKKEN